MTFVDSGASPVSWITGAEQTTSSKGFPNNAFRTSSILVGAMKSGRSFRDDLGQVSITDWHVRDSERII
jgi:hypothetical protein